MLLRMHIVLSHTAALQFWRSPLSPYASLLFDDAVDALQQPTIITKDDATRLRRDLSLPSRIDVVVTSRGNRRPSKLTTCHVMTPSLPEGSLANAGKGLYVCSPALAFAQLAATKTIPELVAYGFELCGTYSILNDADRYPGTCGFIQRPPLLTREELTDFLLACEGMHGIKRARKAVAFVRDGSASPRETAAALIFGLPQRLGGYGFGMPAMNQPIVLSETSRLLSQWEQLHCDLFWPTHRVAIEYDSTAFHTGEDRLARDAKRRTILELERVSVLTLTNQQLNHVESTEAVARALARLMGKRLQIDGKAFSDRCRSLRACALATDPLAHQESLPVIHSESRA